MMPSTRRSRKGPISSRSRSASSSPLAAKTRAAGPRAAGSPLPAGAAERRGVAVTPGVELLDRLPHSAFELGTDAPLGVDDARDGFQPDAGQRGHVDHRRSTRSLGDDVI